jgi:hypothetical protein
MPAPKQLRLQICRDQNGEMHVDGLYYRMSRVCKVDVARASEPKLRFFSVERWHRAWRSGWRLKQLGSDQKALF